LFIIITPPPTQHVSALMSSSKQNYFQLPLFG
jgi:hypothetical protein